MYVCVHQMFASKKVKLENSEVCMRAGQCAHSILDFRFC